MMMMNESVEAPFPNNSKNNKTITCVHCCTPLRHPNVHNDDHIQPSLSQLLESSFNSNNSGTKPLYSLFKLNYLKAFETLDWELEEDANEVKQLTLLCINCNDQLTNLYQIYEDFLQLGKIESSLNKKLSRLDEIIDCHAQKSISCDLIPIVRRDNTNTVSAGLKPSSISNSQLTSRQPQLILSRLSEKDLKLKRTTTTHPNDDDSYSPSSPNYDDDDDENYNSTSSVVKMDVDDNNEIDVLPDIKVKSLESDEDEISLKSRMEQSSSSQKKRKVLGRLKDHKKPKITGPTRGRGRPKGSKSRSKKKKMGKDPTIKEKRHYAKSPVPGCKPNSTYASLKSKFPNPCWYCDRTDFSSPSDCLEHTKKEHLPNVKVSGRFSINVCERCSKICTSAFKTHLSKCLLIPSGAIMEKQFQCTLCPQKCVRMNDLKDHLATHNTERTYSCDMCTYIAKTHATLYNHKKKMHDQLGKERVACNECGKTFKDAEVLRTHTFNMHTVEGYKRYRARAEAILARDKQARMRKLPTFCEECNIDLFSRGSFCNHRRTFHGDSMCEYSCETCGQPFTTRRSLLEHSKVVHSDARPFVCDTCGKSFKRGYTLKSHVLQTHTEEGRLKYNATTRERNRRKKLLKLQLANVAMRQGGGDDSLNVNY